jgi:hypothetical protein
LCLFGLTQCAVEAPLADSLQQVLRKTTGTALDQYPIGSRIDQVPVGASHDSLGYYWQQKVQRDLSWRFSVFTLPIGSDRCSATLLQLHTDQSYYAQQLFDQLGQLLRLRLGTPSAATFEQLLWRAEPQAGGGGTARPVLYALRLHPAAQTVSLSSWQAPAGLAAP